MSELGAREVAAMFVAATEKLITARVEWDTQVLLTHESVRLGERLTAARQALMDVLLSEEGSE